MEYQKFQCRKLQEVASASFSITLPKEYATYLGLKKGDYIKCVMEGRRILIEPLQESNS
jgi:bifunctional DNA-binding transcriptional regulator/antitoxin component of YhaV-PrlF toxin-antitoxin module